MHVLKLTVASSKIASNAQHSVSKALVPAQGISSDLTVQARRVSNQLVKFGRDSQHRVDRGVGVLREVS